jgi:hypothetical protein
VELAAVVEVAARAEKLAADVEDEGHAKDLTPNVEDAVGMVELGAEW